MIYTEIQYNACTSPMNKKKTKKKTEFLAAPEVFSMRGGKLNG